MSIELSSSAGAEAVAPSPPPLRKTLKLVNHIDIQFLVLFLIGRLLAMSTNTKQTRRSHNITTNMQEQLNRFNVCQFENKTKSVVLQVVVHLSDIAPMHPDSRITSKKQKLENEMID